MTLIDVQHLSKVFERPVRVQGRFGALRSFISTRRQQIPAVEDISFQIQRGEMVGYIGPNGAGKSTSMKMLTGILVPSGGRISIAGRNPVNERIAHVRNIGVVFGQRSQLWWDLPTIESFELVRYMYRLPKDAWRRQLALCIDLLELEPFLQTPVRQLSLGQRMRADLTAALLHNPAILFLDEPTIGLDVVAKERIRGFLAHMNREHGVTVLLTTHDLADIHRLCARVILIDHGRVVYDGALDHLRNTYGHTRTLIVDLAQEQPFHLTIPGVLVTRHEGPRVWIQFERTSISASELIATIATHYAIRDLTVEEPELEGIISNVYQRGIDESLKTREHS